MHILRHADLDGRPILLLGHLPHPGRALVDVFTLPAARRATAPLTEADLRRGTVVVSTLPNIQRHACIAQIVELEQACARRHASLRIVHVSGDEAIHWREVDRFHGGVTASRTRSRARANRAASASPGRSASACSAINGLRMACSPCATASSWRRRCRSIRCSRPTCAVSSECSTAHCTRSSRVGSRDGGDGRALRRHRLRVDPACRVRRRPCWHGRRCASPWRPRTASWTAPRASWASRERRCKAGSPVR